MDIKIIDQSKDSIEIQVDNVTIAELLRVYLNKQGVEFAAWRRDHISKPALLRIKSSNKTVKKEITDAISSIKKEIEKIKVTVEKSK